MDGEVDGPEEAHGGVEQEDGQPECGRGGGDFGKKHGGGADGEWGEDEDVAAVRERGVPTEDGEEADGQHCGGDQEVLGDQGEHVPLGVGSFRSTAEDGAEGTENGEEDEQGGELAEEFCGVALGVGREDVEIDDAEEELAVEDL